MNRLRAFVVVQQIQLDGADDLDGALGASKGGAITLLAGLPAAETFSVIR